MARHKSKALVFKPVTFDNEIVMEILQWTSILLEGATALLGLKIVRQGRMYGWGLFLTFSIYVFYDIARLIYFPISQDILYILFFIASVSAFCAIWRLAKGKEK